MPFVLRASEAAEAAFGPKVGAKAPKREVLACSLVAARSPAS